MAKVRMQTSPGGKMRDIVKPNQRWGRQRPITRGKAGYQGDHGAITFATGATAGTPGTWTPAGSEPRQDFAHLSGVTASPATAWTAGQHMILGDFSQAHWSGTAWVAGPKPAAAGLAFDPGEVTVAEVQQHVEEHPDEAADVLAAEQAGKNRTTLVTWLQTYGQ